MSTDDSPYRIARAAGSIIGRHDRPDRSCGVVCSAITFTANRLRLAFHDNLSRRAMSWEARPNMVVLQLARVR